MSVAKGGSDRSKEYMSTRKQQLSSVGEFWGTEACGTHFVPDARDSADFYKKFREQRYRTEWHIPLLVPFADAKGQSVLEIGTGNGADAAMFALNGALYTGVDLTETALDATRRHFEVLNLTGVFQRENAEALSFPDESFDWVYSHGVLHHTPNPQKAINEVWRVLKPNGRAIVMLYHKRSFNYYVRIMLYMRARVLLKIISRFGRWKRDRSQLQAGRVVGVRGNQNPKVWDLHYQNFLREGWKYLRSENFVHHCTDGPECPVAFAYSKREARQLFGRFQDVSFQIAHFPLRRYSRLVPFHLERILAQTMGWYLFIFAKK
jgi:ubiquinone/menaquinone biosynthesis C-methylase UbiE